MALKINTDVASLSALRNIQQSSLKELESYERLSTGLKINRGSDDPSGLVIFQALRGQLNVINQAVENTQNAYNMVQTAEAGLGEIGDLLNKGRALALQAMNTGALGPNQQKALQLSMNSLLDAVDRVANTTRYAGTNLLNGNMNIQVANADPELADVQVTSGAFQGEFPQRVNVNVTSAATRAQAGGTIAAVQSDDSTIRISGNLGTEDISIAAGATQAEVETAINNVSDKTGIESVGGFIRSVDYGSEASVNLVELEGDLEGITSGKTTGTDVVALVNGEATAGEGNVITAHTGELSARITVESGATGNFSFDVLGGGATFQLGASVSGGDRMTLGIPSANTTELGNSSGLSALSALRTGGTYNLTDNPGDAMRILDAAAGEVSETRGRLGSVSGTIFESNIRSLDIAFENISASASAVADANLAEEVSNLIRNRVVKEAGLKVLQQMNMNAGVALRLLGATP
ncbi:MAG: hypothetical protein A2Z34_03775 [Planctomycetes bacterium RBG_16_59_8]|nr:MAG: hypothetical protein A2Z34_03775 [Planctomycetes bacterium RBG_16_59_8]